jgi:nitroreductase
MKVSDAVNSRKSIRAFLDTPIETSLLVKLLNLASRSPSGGNLQPWHIYLLNGKKMTDFKEFMKRWENPELPQYEIYPSNLKEPYRTSRFELGEAMYDLLSIPRDDKAARFAHLMENFNFFGAPSALFCFVDATMGPPQWSDLGMFLQTFMLLAQEHGIDTCAQEAWAVKPDSLREFFSVPNELNIFCGMAIGYKDAHAKVNELHSQRRSSDQWLKIFE